MAMYQRAGGEPLAVAAVTFYRSILDPCRAVNGAFRRAGGRARRAACAHQLRAPGHTHPAAQRSTAPPWKAPRDAIAYIAAAGLEPQPLTSNESSRIVNLKITLKTSRSWSTARSTQLQPECV